MKLLRYNPEQLKLIIDGIIAGFEYINTLNTKYNITIYIIELNNEFKVEILWNIGTHIEDDENVLIGRSDFKINKVAELLDLAVSVNNILDEMTKVPFSSELQDFEFNQLNND